MLQAAAKSPSGKFDGSVPDRRLPDRLGHVEQHERQRGDRQPGDRDARRRPLRQRKAGPPQRPRQHGAEHQRHVPHGDSRRRGDCRSRTELIPALAAARTSRSPRRPTQWDKIIKIGRTHLADATPLRLGQEFGGFARQIELSIERAERAMRAVLELPAGGTAVGTGINTHPEFGRRVAAVLAEGNRHSVRRGGQPLRSQRPARRAGRVPRPAADDRRRRCSTSPTTSAGSASGPRCGFYEVEAARPPAGQLDHAGQGEPGDVRKHDAGRGPRDRQRSDASPFSGATGGQFQLNIMMPVMGHTTLETIELLAAGTHAFVEFCTAGLEANEASARRRSKRACRCHQPQPAHRLRDGGRTGQGSVQAARRSASSAKRKGSCPRSRWPRRSILGE